MRSVSVEQRAINHLRRVIAAAREDGLADSEILDVAVREGVFLQPRSPIGEFLDTRKTVKE